MWEEKEKKFFQGNKLGRAHGSPRALRFESRIPIFVSNTRI